MFVLVFRNPKHLCSKFRLLYQFGWFGFLLEVWFGFVILRRGSGRLAYCNTGSHLDVCDLW